MITREQLIEAAKRDAKEFKKFLEAAESFKSCVEKRYNFLMAYAEQEPIILREKMKVANEAQAEFYKICSEDEVLRIKEIMQEIG